MALDPVPCVWLWTDGYPRTVHQAGVLEVWLRSVGLCLHGAVSIELEEWVAVAKVMARHACSLCGKSFNSAHIVIDGYDMPAMLPPAPGLCGGKDDKPCPVHDKGGYDTREDDRDEAVVKRRYEVYRQQTAPLMGFYEERGLLHRFTVKRGIKDAPTLMQAMLQRQTGKKKHH
jgi:adenylate kinase